MTEHKIAVLGAGSWGTALANVAAENGHNVMLWTYKESQVPEINELHTNAQYLGDNPLHHGVIATADMKTAVDGAELVLSVVPTKVTRQVVKHLAQVLVELNQSPIVMAATKGLEPETYLRVSEVLSEEIPAKYRRGLGVISGPSHAEGVIKHDPTLVTAVSENLAIAQAVQGLMTNSDFRMYTGTDVIGAEIGGALKNVIAIGAGALETLGYDANAKAALFTRGLAEIGRLGQAYGANPITFMGLSGMGDLFVTATSVHSRNYRAGQQLGEGKSLAQIEADMGMIIEGISTTKVAHEIAQAKHVDMPITDMIYEVLYNDKDIKLSVCELMGRPTHQEGN
ncbi:NAD(P)H-dependent glycerol-3-phosphate dehydrogenase [Weissella ceti]|uniref:Glycerol-3-phosphate dehydrogenase [NAD(P)+] n=1 Tax=Weissella ceti TaxID=759620 RepID=A0ABT3E5G1_9LACO|nr:NAD(P)H-dependent glycerol-3-phosphate dehydrogenase [Weissella ceti]MCW0953655.1 NAD(P)H-dependent glycerol-3-phosphate dehydrogenase [Weissella ceti]QVK12262.1 NAD(P)H-dependent glycerol-3-phosphate dehydrogenase [Weissella ceti]